MKFIDSTADTPAPSATSSSTSAIDAAVRTLDPAVARQVLAYLDQAQLLAAKIPTADDAAHARQARTDRLEAVVTLALDNRTLLAHLGALHPVRRVTAVLAHIRRHPDRYGDLVPSREIVRRVLVSRGLVD